MGFRFRKSFKCGPFRTTISKSGVSTSFGVKGYRVTKRADGKTQTTYSIPDTGISYVSQKQTEPPQKQPQQTKENQSIRLRLWLLILLFAMIMAGMFVACAALIR